MMLRYVNGYIFEGHTFVVNKSDIHNAKDEQFAAGTALMPDGWISVEDRLPEKSQLLIVHCKGGSKEFISVVPYSAKHKEFNWYDGIGKPPENRKEYRNATHWMPLPEPPKGDDDDED